MIEHQIESLHMFRENQKTQNEIFGRIRDTSGGRDPSPRFTSPPCCQNHRIRKQKTSSRNLELIILSARVSRRRIINAKLGCSFRPPWASTSNSVIPEQLNSRRSPKPFCKRRSPVPGPGTDSSKLDVHFRRAGAAALLLRIITRLRRLASIYMNER